VNWDMLGAVGELIGAAAVVLTLFYLAHQVREASRESQRNRWGDLNAEISRVADSWGANDALSEVVYRGLHDADSLDPHEAFRFYSSLFRLFRAWEAVFQYSRDGGLHRWGAEGFTTTMSDILGFPGAQAYWLDRKHWFSPAFRNEVDGLLQGVSPSMAEAYHRESTA